MGYRRERAAAGRLYPATHALLPPVPSMLEAGIQACGCWPRAQRPRLYFQKFLVLAQTFHWPSRAQ